MQAIGKYIYNTLTEELANFLVIAKFATTAPDGKIYQAEHYNLDMTVEYLRPSASRVEIIIDFSGFGGTDDGSQFFTGGRTYFIHRFKMLQQSC